MFNTLGNGQMGNEVWIASVPSGLWDRKCLRNIKFSRELARRIVK
jgi:hypothetical protein